MRRYLLMIWIVYATFGFAGAASAAPVSPQAKSKVAAILNQFPAGGPALRAAISQAVETDPSLAAAVVDAAVTANAAQQQAIGAGLADAVRFFAAIGTDWARAAEQMIVAALADAPVAVAAAYAAANGPTLAQGGISPLNNAGMSTDHCVSPSHPPGNGHGFGRGHNCD